MPGPVDGSPAAVTTAAQPLVEQVWAVSKTHLDVGFTGQPEEVLDRFVHRYIPAAIAVTDQLEGGDPPLVWTLGSWLVWWSLEQATLEERRAIERAIEEGRLVWHALPFSLHTELLDGWLLDQGLAISADLDRRFGHQTIAAKMTDVPGHSVALVPHLAAAGVTFLHIGVNSASQVPRTPPLFRWRVAGSEVVVAYSSTYGEAQELPGGRALSVSVTGDNTGPPTAAQHLAKVADLAAAYPGARIVASGLDPVAAHLGGHLGELPVLEAEIGDSWIHGVGGDPTLLARFRDLLRRRRASAGASRADADQVAWRADARQLLLIPEHTWGLDTKKVLTADDPFDRAGFAEACRAGRYEPLERSWAAKVAPIERTRHARPWVSETEPVPGGRPSLPGGARLDQDGWQVEVLDHGGLRILRWPGVPYPADAPVTDGSLGPTGFPAPTMEVGRYSYQTFDVGDYRRFFGSYIRPDKRGEPWVVGDYAKPGLERQPVRSGRTTARLVTAWGPDGDGDLSVLVRLEVPEGTDEAYGAPRRLVARYQLAAGHPHVQVTLWRSEKTACRLPEAEWYRFVVDQSDTRLYWHKIDRWIPADSVVPGGGNRLHATQQGALWFASRGWSVHLDSLDSPLLAPGDGYLLDPGVELPPPEAGASVCLTNNVWGTNFRMWNDQACCHRFVLRLVPVREAAAMLG